MNAHPSLTTLPGRGIIATFRWCSGCLLLLTSGLKAAEPSGGPVPVDKGGLSESGKFQPKDVSPATIPNPAARLAELGVRAEGDLLRIGVVELDRKARTVSFPAKVHAVEGVIEYLLVHSKGKIHETLLVTEALPQDIHIACLLAGWGERPEHEPTPILIEASWETNGPIRCEAVENLVAFAKNHPQGQLDGHLAAGPWNYTGSIIDAAGFAATREGSIISLISDPAALICNPRPGREDDTLHVPNGKMLPLIGISVKIILRAVPDRKP